MSSECTNDLKWLKTFINTQTDGHHFIDSRVAIELTCHVYTTDNIHISKQMHTMPITNTQIKNIIIRRQHIKCENKVI